MLGCIKFESFVVKEVDMHHETETSRYSNLISSRLGPIVDKFASVVSQEDLKAILVIQLEAQIKAAQEDIRTLEQVIKVVKGTR